MESTLHLGLPWRMLRPQLVNRSTDNMLEYKYWLADLAKEQLSHEVMVQKLWMRVLWTMKALIDNPKGNMDEKMEQRLVEFKCFRF